MFENVATPFLMWGKTLAIERGNCKWYQSYKNDGEA